VAHSRPQNNPPLTNTVVEKHTETVIEKTVVQEVDTEKLKAELLGDLLPGLQSAIAAEMGKMAAQMVSPAPQEALAAPAPVDPAQLEAAMENVLRRVGMPSGGTGAAPGARRSSGPAEPVFIPKTIVSKDTKAKIDVKQKTSEGAGDLDDADAALRALRSKRRGKKNVNEEKS